jgi:hypothetical protein
MGSSRRLKRRQMPSKSDSTRKRSTGNDTRVVYGAHCSWWDSIDNAGRVPGSSLPGCPYCGSPLYEAPNIDEYLKGAYERGDDYVAMLMWLRGRECFRSLADAVQAWEKHKGN